MAITTTTIIDIMKNTSGFISDAVNNEVEITYPTSTTEVYTYKNGGTTYYAITITYVDSTKANISSVKRTT